MRIVERVVDSMDEVNVTKIDIDGKEYFLIDSISDDKNVYNFFCNPNDKDDIYVLKNKNEGEDSFYVSLDDDNEIDYAFSLFFQKYNEQVIGCQMNQ